MTHTIATLIGPPGTRPPTNDAALAIVAHGGSIRKEEWIENGIAYDIHYEGGDPLEMQFVMRTLAERAKVDIVLQHGPRREMKLFVSDMDSTIIEQECIDELADKVGCKKKVAAITARAMNGEIGFEGALRERVALLKGLTTADLQHVLDTRITLMPGASTLVATLHARGIHTLLVSGGFTFFTGAIRTRAGFDADLANTLIMEHGALTGDVGEPILGREAKREALLTAAREHDIPLGRTIAIGDGANDLPMLQEAGLGIAYHAKPAVEAEVGVRIRYNDLTALLYILGIPKHEWVIPTPDA